MGENQDGRTGLYAYILRFVMRHTTDNFDRVSCFIQPSFSRKVHTARGLARPVNENESVCNEEAIRYVLYVTLHFLWAQN